MFTTRAPSWVLSSAVALLLGFSGEILAQEEDDFFGLEEEEAEEAVEPKPDPSPELLRRGRRLYGRRCIFCHGGSGEGNGPVARGIFPRPRNFTRGVFKIRSTPSGFPPTDEDLFETLERGMPGTMMPSFSNLRRPQLWALVFYVKSFYAPPDTPNGPTVPIPVDREVPSTMESIGKGRGLYLDLGCSRCHGDWGRGDGPASSDLIDDWGFPIVVADLNEPKLLRGGHSERELLRALATGIGGTPMPAFGDAVSEEELWHLVNYLRSRMSE